jgi:hypothetical protein
MPATMSDLSAPLESYRFPGFGADALAFLLPWLTMKLIGPDRLRDLAAGRRTMAPLCHSHLLG